jgi:hypothetical protein
VVTTLTFVELPDAEVGFVADEQAAAERRTIAATMALSGRFTNENNNGSHSEQQLEVART